MLSYNQSRQRGFTLIELVVVIVIIGILAAFAIPRFANIARDARLSSLNAMAGALRSSSALLHGMALARNTASGANLNLEGQDVLITNGYPAGTAAGITAALSNLDVAVYVPVYAGAAPALTATYTVAGGGANCSVVYTGAAPGGAASVAVNPGATLTDGTGC